MRAPEHIALAASEQHGPAADAWAAEKRRRFAHEGRELAEMAKRRHATLARFEGAATGVGGVITLVPDMVGLAWIQTRLVFFVAAAYGYDPRDPMRPAELLVLMELYDDVHDARAPRSTAWARRSPSPTSARGSSARRCSRCGSRRCSAGAGSAGSRGA